MMAGVGKGLLKSRKKVFWKCKKTYERTKRWLTSPLAKVLNIWQKICATIGKIIKEYWDKIQQVSINSKTLMPKGNIDITIEQYIQWNGAMWEARNLFGLFLSKLKLGVLWLQRQRWASTTTPSALSFPPEEDHPPFKPGEIVTGLDVTFGLEV